VGEHQFHWSQLEVIGSKEHDRYLVLRVPDQVDRASMVGSIVHEQDCVVSPVGLL
jgi:hypothetical protein